MKEKRIARGDHPTSRADWGRGHCPAKAIGTLAFAAALLALATAARAECELTVADVAHGADGIPEDAVMRIDAFGIRKGLARNGIEVGGYYYGETFYNWGGFDQGGEYDGVLELYVKADMHKLGFWKGLCFHADGYQIHGNSITAANIGALMPVSNLEATDATRLFELWFEQHLFNDKLAVKVGQLAADAEFIISEGGGYFLNGTWGWPSITASDLPSGGPAYPLATPGVRVAVTDADGDSRADVIVGSGEGSTALARVYRGAAFGGGEPATFTDLDPFGGLVLADGVFVG